MGFIIRKLKAADRSEVLKIMRTFYNSSAVLTNGSEEIYQKDFENCINDNPFLEGWFFEEDGNAAGYGMIAKSFSTEYGRECVWIEDIYLKPEYRKKGYGSKFFDFIDKRYPDALKRLEAEPDNRDAVSFYKKCGYEVMAYTEFKKD